VHDDAQLTHANLTQQPPGEFPDSLILANSIESFAIRIINNSNADTQTPAGIAIQ